MTVDVMPMLLSALNLAVFQRHADGAFTAVAPPPEWFRHLRKGRTFPFLGGFLDEAREFWARENTGRVSSGLCAETDENGREFHFEVSAVAFGARQFLVFTLAREADALRATLQTAREQALSVESAVKRDADVRHRLGALTASFEAAQESAHRVVTLTGTLGETPLDDRQREILAGLHEASERLLARVAGLVATSRAVAQSVSQT